MSGCPGSGKIGPGDRVGNAVGTTSFEVEESGSLGFDMVDTVDRVENTEATSLEVEEPGLFSIDRKLATYSSKSCNSRSALCISCSSAARLKARCESLKMSFSTVSEASQYVALDSRR